LPALAVGALGAYGLAAILLTTTNLVAGLIWMRHHFGRAAPGRTPAWHDWIAALGTNRFRRLATRSAQAGLESADDGVVLPAPFYRAEARREIGRRNYICLARSHFLSVLIVLVGIIGLGVAQNNGALPFQTGVIPTVSATLIVAGLLLLAVLGRIAIDVTAEPLLENYCPADGRTRRNRPSASCRVVLEAGRGRPVADDSIGELPARFPERLVAAFEQGHLPLLNAVSRLSEITQALEAAMRTSVEAFETAMRSAAVQQRPVDDDKVLELQAAVEELTAVLAG